ncbi:MAG: hypothetical protein JWP27_922 [Flaviaesturariibacter sp.]|nr:hypothetical protein [Flaviaesturariibacter sp.]
MICFNRNYLWLVVKKALAAILLLAYFMVSTGFTVNLHYCMNKFQSWDVGAAKEKCGRCGMKVRKASGCCRDEVKVVKLQQDVLGAAAIVYDLTAPAVVGNAFFYADIVPHADRQPSLAPLPHGPPMIGRQDTYLRNCVFRI